MTSERRFVYLPCQPKPVVTHEELAPAIEELVVPEPTIELSSASVTIAGIDLSQYCTSVRVEVDTNQVDVTAYGDVQIKLLKGAEQTTLTLVLLDKSFMEQIAWPALIDLKVGKQVVQGLVRLKSWLTEAEPSAIITHTLVLLLMPPMQPAPPMYSDAWSTTAGNTSNGILTTGGYTNFGYGYTSNDSWIKAHSSKG